MKIESGRRNCYGPNTHVDRGVVLCGAPTTIVDPLMLLDTPNASLAAPSEATSCLALDEFFRSTVSRTRIQRLVLNSGRPSCLELQPLPYSR